MEDLKLSQERFEELSKMSASMMEKKVKKSELLDFIHDLNVKAGEKGLVSADEEETPDIERAEEPKSANEETEEVVTEMPCSNLAGDYLEVLEKYENLYRAHKVLKLMCGALILVLLISVCA